MHGGAILGFVLALVLTSIFATVGFEVRHCLISYELSREARYAYMAFGLLAANLAAIGATYQLIVRRARLRMPRFFINGAKHVPRMREGHAIVRDLVSSRAKELGISAEVEVRYLSATVNLYDAYVAPTPRGYRIVMTGGLYHCLLSEAHRQRPMIKFILDHELGHIANRDIRHFLAARAALVVLLVALPLKLLTIWLMGLDAMGVLFFDAYPQAGEPILGLVTVELAEPRKIALVAIAVYGLFVLVAWMLYRQVVRLREHSADEFAKLKNLENAHEALGLALRGQRVTLGPMAFRSIGATHPTHSARLDSLRDPEPTQAAMVNRFALALLLSIAFIRFISVPFSLIERAPSAVFEYWMWFASASLIAVFACMASSLVQCDDDEVMLLVVKNVAVACLVLLVLDALLGNGKYYLFSLFGKGDDDPFTRAEREPLIAVGAIELIERAAMFMSVPVLFGVFVFVAYDLSSLFSVTAGSIRHAGLTALVGLLAAFMLSVPLSLATAYFREKATQRYSSSPIPPSFLRSYEIDQSTRDYQASRDMYLQGTFGSQHWIRPPLSPLFPWHRAFSAMGVSINR